MPVINRGHTILNDPVYLEYAAPVRMIRRLTPESRVLTSCLQELSWNVNPGGPVWEVPNMTLSGKTNIYQVGLIMASAMRLINPLPENNWRRPPPGYSVPQARQLHHNRAPPRIGVGELPPRRLNPGPKRYTNRLVRLVYLCLKHDPAQRPTATMLLHMIRQNARFQGMDAITLASGPLTTAEKALCIDVNPDKYARGKRF